MSRKKQILITVFGGWFGLHKYWDKKIGMGILYTFTFGLFYIGWIHDIIIAIKNPKDSTASAQKNEYSPSPSAHVKKQSTLLTVHPDLKDLLWIGDGPYKNYTRRAEHEECININGYTIRFSTYGSDEPSLIRAKLPVQEPKNPSEVPRPPYYPSYDELSPEQRWLYLDFLKNPYTGTHDIGYVFILYYGLERFLFSDQGNHAFEVILKLRDNYSNNSFQAYSSAALILFAIVNKDVSLAKNFLDSIDKTYEMKIPAGLLILLKYSLSLPLTSYEVMNYAKIFGFNNQRYIKNNPETFLGFLQEAIRNNYGSDFVPIGDMFNNADINKIPATDYPAFANISITNKIVRIPLLTEYTPFKAEMYKLLMTAHESTKKYLAELRKKNSSTTVKDTPKLPKQ